MSSLDYLDLCRLCLVKDRVSVPIFEGEGDVRQIFLKIAACLPVKVTREDKLPKKICDDCVYKVELFYQFWNTTANAEKQLLQWLGEVNIEDKQGYVTNVLNPNVMKQEQRPENRLDGNVMQQVGEHQNNMGMGMMDNMGLGIPMMISNANQQQQITSVPMDTSGNSVQPVQAVPGPSSQTTHNQISQNQSSSTQQEDEEESSEDEENSDDECDGDEGLPVKEESEEDPNNRTIEPTTFVNVSLACDEAGPSGLQQKISDIPEMPMPQTADGDPKTGKSTQQINQKHKSTVGAQPKDELKASSKPATVLQRRLLFRSSKIRRHKSNKSSTYKIKYEDHIDLQEEESSNKEKPPLKRPPNKKSPMDSNNYSDKLQNKNSSQEDLYKKLHDGTYTCDICQTTFEQKSKILRHITSKHSFHRPFKCQTCDKTFKYKCDLKAHKLVHQEIDSSLLHCCDKCDYRTKTKNNLKSHYIRRHTDDYKFACEHCGKRFKMEWDLKFHVGTHSNSQHMCDVCGKFYTSNYSLYKHRKVAHLNEYKFQCTVCNKRLLTQENLDNHMQQHSRTYECKECGKVFASKRYLATHTTTHTGVKPYTCQICKKNFRTSHMRNTHLLTHSAERPHICDLCGQSFKRRYYMIEHRRKHPDAHLSSPPVPLGRKRNVGELDGQIVTEYRAEISL
ncbi:zinc finger protein 320-like isoform X8 [Osmia bicornis bicornis]|uniref:zinc finger protein 320-like isoform X8 n=1 Tax=Osmia bicornis bicornis TaxID=1437191 RepID=UPI001EAF8C20|nr:zinc finger protein 320-like isoform X8 [Osmia bicornis bicornis]